MLEQLFGGKAWFKSMTTWGGLLLTLAWTLVPEAGALGIIEPETASTLTAWMTKAGSLLGLFGIRRRLPR